MATIATITYNNVPDIVDSGPGDIIFGGIDLQMTNGVLTIDLFQEFVLSRLTANHIEIGADVNAMAFNTSQSFNSDFGTIIGFDSAIDSVNQVFITLEPGWTVNTAEIITFDSDVSIGFVNDNTPVPDPLSFLDSTVGGAEPCVNIDVEVFPSGGTGPYQVAVNGSTIPGTTFTANRGTQSIVTVTDSAGGSTSRTISFPRAYVASDFNIDIIQRPEGATVNVQTIVPVSDAEPLSYSLDNSNFVNSGTFSGQFAGNYTVFIRDRLGCVISIPYIISAVSPEDLDPLFILPESNSIRYYRSEDNTCTVRPNYYNTQSCKEPVRGIAYEEPNFFEPCDSITTQFKTNETNLSARLLFPDGSEQVLPIVERVTNIGLQDVRDSKYFRVDSSHIGIFFDAGNTYDPVTLNPSGTYSQLNGLLPSFIAEGVFIDVVGLGVKEVISTEFDQSRQVWYAKVSGSLFSSATFTARASTRYNVQPYNVYEVVVSMQTRLNTNFKVEISTDLTTYISEQIRVIEEVPGVVIHYWNSENKFDIVYASTPLVQHTLRVRELDVVKMVPLSLVENYNSDNAPIQLDSKLYKQFELRGENITTSYYFKIALALSHDVVFINGLQMTLQEITQDENIENTNLYNPRFLMIEGGNAAERQREETVNLTTLAAIRLEANLGFINYRG